MDKATAQTSIKNVYGETFSLSPSSLITLFEIDIGPIGFSMGKISTAEVEQERNTIFRFHNNVKSTHSSIIWQGQEYVAAPIVAEGFEITSRGTLPSPTLKMTVNEEGVPHLAMLKNRIYQLGEIIGAKVTRIRTFAKYIDESNFFDSRAPDGFIPDNNAELPRDIFFIERKVLENKFQLEFELSTSLNLEGKKLPGRLVLQNNCPFMYRGDGCFYEFSGRRSTDEHGDAVLPVSAPPVANYFNESIAETMTGVTITDRGEYNPDITYNSGEFCYLEHNNIKYYYVANGVDIQVAPPNGKYWLADECSHQSLGCELRYGVNGGAAGNIVKGVLQFGGFPSVNRFR